MVRVLILVVIAFLATACNDGSLVNSDDSDVQNISPAENASTGAAGSTAVAERTAPPCCDNEPRSGGGTFPLDGEVRTAGGDFPLVKAFIVVDSITADDVVNAPEASGDIDVTGTVGGDAETGDSVSFTLNGTLYSGSVTGSTFSISVAGGDLENDISFTTTVAGVDGGGNPFEASATSTHTVDTVTSATITVDNITADDVVNTAVESLGDINVTGSVGEDAAPGDTVSVTVNGTDYMGSIATGNTFSIPVSGSDLENDTSFDVTVVGTDDVGNQFSAMTTSTHTVINSVPATAATAVLSFDIKTFRFTWTDVSDATAYRLLENPDGSSGFSQVGIDVVQGAQTIDHIVPLYKRVNASYILQSCNSLGCTDSASINITGTLADAIGYFKASNTGASDFFGYSVSLSDDGATLAVGAYAEDSNAYDSGAVYVFAHDGTTWSQQAYIKSSDPGTSDYFGYSVSLSRDGNTLAVGSGVAKNSGDKGEVFVFTRSNSTWSQQASIMASNSGGGDRFGISVSLNGDGNTLAVGAIFEDSNATGIDGNQSDNSAASAGAVYVFTRNGSNWSQQAYVKPKSSLSVEDFLRVSVSLSGDGDTLAAGAFLEDGGATGIGGPQTDNLWRSGAVFLY